MFIYQTLFVLLYATWRLVSAAHAVPSCSLCPLNYHPVVDEETGMPFYNDCIARCQLGPGAKLIPGSSAGHRAAAAGPAKDTAGRNSDASGAPSPYKMQLMRLMPKPSDAARKYGRQLQPDLVTSDTITRFAAEGYLFVGRPGFISGDSGSSASKRRSATSALSGSKDGYGGSTQTSAGGSTDNAPGPFVTLRMTYPEGDMYMKLWSSDELKAPADEYGGGFISASNQAKITSTLKTSGTPHLSSRRRVSRALLTHGVSSISGGTDDRREVQQPTYPFSAVVFLNSSASFTCSGALVGPTGRLVVTAAQCLYRYNSVDPGSLLGWYKNFQVAPGLVNGNIAPFGWHNSDTAEVRLSWTNAGDWAADIGFLRLSYHLTAPGSLGCRPLCSQRNYTMTTAGYPTDKVHGTMWTQGVNATLVDVCNGPDHRLYDFDTAVGQVGSVFWTSDGIARFVASSTTSINNGSGNGATAITPLYASWMNDYTNKNIRNVPLRILVGSNSSIFVRCNTTTLRCEATTDRTMATRFSAYPISGPNKYAFQLPGTSLCMSISTNVNTSTANTTYRNVSTVDVVLEPCNANWDFRFGLNALWNVGPFGLDTGTQVVRADSGGYLWWDGRSTNLKAVSECISPGPCTWRVDTPPASNALFHRRLLND